VTAADNNRAEEEKIRELYFCAFSREPDEKELSFARTYLEKKPVSSKDGKPDAAPNKRQAYEDIIWALINTKEFLFNH